MLTRPRQWKKTHLMRCHISKRTPVRSVWACKTNQWWSRVDWRWRRRQATPRLKTYWSNQGKNSTRSSVMRAINYSLRLTETLRWRIANHSQALKRDLLVTLQTKISRYRAWQPTLINPSAPVPLLQLKRQLKLSLLQTDCLLRKRCHRQSPNLSLKSNPK